MSSCLARVALFLVNNGITNFYSYYTILLYLPYSVLYLANDSKLKHLHLNSFTHITVTVSHCCSVVCRIRYTYLLILYGGRDDNAETGGIM